MNSLINNIKKYFIYIVGIVFFIIAIYIMLMPPNCALNKMNIKEGFANSSSDNPCVNSNTRKLVDSITCYRNIVSQQKNKDPKTTFDKNYLEFFSKSLPDNSSDKKKLLIMSRCYETPGAKDLLIDMISNAYKTNAFVSYTEIISDLKSVTDFSSVLEAITTNVNTFYNLLNMNSGNIPNKIKGCVYALIFQTPIYRDNSDKNNINNININRNIFPQSLNKNDLLVYYSPSFIGKISNNIINPNKKNSSYNTSTPISYYVYLIYDQYNSGPNSSSGKITLANKGNTFSNSTPKTQSMPGISKTYLDERHLSGAEQCYINAMGPGGMDYIGGCTSISETKNNNNSPNSPVNSVLCQSQKQEDYYPWSYFVLYTVNMPSKIEDIVYMSSKDK